MNSQFLMNEKNNFYSNLYSQSAYRRHISEDKGRERHSIDLELSAIPGLNEESKKALRSRINDDFAYLINALLPPNIHEQVINSDLLTTLYKGLGVE